MSREQIIDEIHKPARKTFQRRRVVLKGLNDLWQADLAEMIPYAKTNNNYKYILVVIDCFSKYVQCEPLKNKTGDETTKAMEKIIKRYGKNPKNLQTDDGKEFFNSSFKKLMNAYRINHYSTFSVKKASIVERVIRTLKEIMWKHFSKIGKYKWIDDLQKMIASYNNTFHRTIKMKPNEVNESNEKKLLNTVYSNIKIVKKAKFKVGDYVRISKQKSLFDKGYLPNWSTELFIISTVRLTNPRTYILTDIDGTPIKGGFYEQELQKTAYPDIYLVEKVLRTKNKKMYVKWLGLPASKNSWIDKKDLV